MLLRTSLGVFLPPVLVHLYCIFDIIYFMFYMFVVVVGVLFRAALLFLFCLGVDVWVGTTPQKEGGE